MDVAVPWDPAPASSVARGEDTPPGRKDEKEGSDDILIDNQLVKKLAEKLFLVESYGTLFFYENNKAR
jgi:hypothetical protein